MIQGQSKDSIPEIKNLKTKLKLDESQRVEYDFSQKKLLNCKKM